MTGESIVGKDGSHWTMMDAAAGMPAAPASIPAPAPASPPARVEWVDAAKGVGILLVIAGHVWTRGQARDAIYAFHMPLFFLLSGYMVKPQPTVPLILKQARSLLLPFAVFSIMLVCADILIEGMRGIRPIFPSLGAGLHAIIFRTETLRGPFTILWFVPALFFARILWNILALRMPGPADWRWVALISLVMGGAHWVAQHSHASPLGLMAVPAALTMYWAGQLWRARPPRPLAMLLLLAPLAVATLFWFPPVNLKGGDFGMPVLSLAGAVAVSILLRRPLALLSGTPLDPLAWLGRVSLVIMYVHVAFIHYCAPYFGKPVLFVIALVGSLALHFIFSATRAGRVVFLGER